MPSDAWADLNRRAAAVPGFQWYGGTAAWLNHKQVLPGLRSAATRGILRAALGSPSMRLDRIKDGLYSCEILSECGRYQLAYGEGDTREQAEAGALVALAEARNEWGPE